MMTLSPEDKLIRGLENFADALESGDDLAERFTCRKVVLNLEPTPYTPELVKETRAALGLSQALFAQFLGVSTGTIQAWERGEKPPRNVACRLMDEIRRDPDYWRKRFLELAEEKAASA
jgi:putative transcriptional regulator